MKLNREALAHYLDTTFKNELTTASWEIIGTDIEDMSVELNPDVSTLKNILGETKTVDNGYEPSIDADPFYADPTSALYPTIKEIAFNRKKGEDCKTLMLEVLIESTEETAHMAYVTPVVVKPQSYGGDTAGINIPFKITEDGARIKGTVTITDGVPKFTKSTT